MRQREAQRGESKSLRTRKWEGPGEGKDGKERGMRGAMESQGGMKTGAPCPLKILLINRGHQAKPRSL